MQVKLIDATRDRTVWTGTDDELIDANEGAPEIFEALQDLNRGALSVTIGGGAAPAFRVEPVHTTH